MLIKKRLLAICVSLLLTQQGLAQAADHEKMNRVYDLSSLITFAVTENPSVLSKLDASQGASSDLDYAKAQYLPTPSVSFQRRADDKNNTVASIDQPLWTGGKLDAGYDQATARLESSKYAIDEAKYTVALKVVQAYQQWLKNRLSIDVYHINIQRLDEYMVSVNRRIDLGFAPLSDRYLVDSRLVQTKSDLSAAQMGVDIALDQLSQLTGQEITSAMLNTKNALAINKVPSQAGLIDTSLAVNPMLKRLTSDIQASEYDVILKGATAYPTVSAKVEYSRDDLYANTLAHNDTRAMLAVQFNPSAGGFSYTYQVDAGKAKVKELKQQLQASKRELSSQISSDYYTYTLSDQKLQDMQLTIDTSKMVLDSYIRLYDAGKRSWLEVINAARELMQSELSYADVYAQKVTMNKRLDIYLGNGYAGNHQITE